MLARTILATARPAPRAAAMARVAAQRQAGRPRDAVAALQQTRHLSDKGVTRRMEFLSRRLDRMRAAPGIFEPGVSHYEPGYEPVEET